MQHMHLEALYLSEVGLPHRRVSAERFVVRIYGLFFVPQRLAELTVGEEMDRIARVLSVRERKQPGQGKRAHRAGEGNEHNVGMNHCLKEMVART